jgi:hypothetical protein
MEIKDHLRIHDFENRLPSFWELSGEKILAIKKQFDPSRGTPVFTVKGKYTTRGWTEWTQGFQFGSSILQFDATQEDFFLDYGRGETVNRMAPHISHTGVHDHGFNNLSTYGNLLRLMVEGKIPENQWERDFYKLALKISGAVQASRWTSIPGGGFIHSFNGAHSLFVDTIRSCRILMLSHQLGHVLQTEGDACISLMERAIEHIRATATYSVFYGEGRDRYDEWGRTAHESVFNVKDGQFRCPNSQQGYTGFSTWTRGLAWAMLGFSEEMELVDGLPESDFPEKYQKEEVINLIVKAARATCDFYIKNTPVCGIPYWDTGAPSLYKLGDYLNKPADPFNDYEPVDSSAAAIGAQGLLRLGHFLKNKGDESAGSKYWQAGLSIVNSLLHEPYLSTDPNHEGLLLHSIYHHPNNWDYVPNGKSISSGESSQWGDYHFRELILYLQKILKKESYYTFFTCVNHRNN